jgi:ribosomal-protein-alanine N-acetyltransferase
LERGKRTFVTLADKSYEIELAALKGSNFLLHQPWIYHGDNNVYLDKIAKGSTIGFFLWEATHKSLIGVINLNEPVLGLFKSAYLSYYVDMAFSRNGYMTEGLALVLNYVFNEQMFHRLEANIQPENLASINLVKRLGFRYEGFSPKYLYINDIWCDHERWAILADEWKAPI